MVPWTVARKHAGRPGGSGGGGRRGMFLSYILAKLRATGGGLPVRDCRSRGGPVDLMYLDHAATMMMSSEVREAMLPFLGERWIIPSSGHRWGRKARNAIEEARERVAQALGAHR